MNKRLVWTLVIVVAIVHAKRKRHEHDTTAVPSQETTTTIVPGSNKCWTCPPKYIHWYEAGLDKSENGEECECVLASDYDAHGCRYCPEGYKHYYELGYSAPSHYDKCLCIDKHGEHEHEHDATPTPTTEDGEHETTEAPTPEAVETSAPTFQSTLAATIKALTTSNSPVAGKSDSGENKSVSNAGAIVASIGTFLAIFLIYINVN